MKYFFVVIFIVVVLVAVYFFMVDSGPGYLQEDAMVTDELSDLIVLESPRVGEGITSPLTIRGRARGMWFFEATFPVVLTDWDGRIIAEHYAEAKDEWMTVDFVPFEAVLEFENPAGGEDFTKRGSLILHKSNASGLPEHDNSLEISIVFE